ncbi:MAG: hypothetical protein M3O20_01375 [Acidobacteriota bacterium]|nr:hypothetical protein [Acidobacteriota bacterium]
MALTTNKKVFVTRFERESVQGFVQTPGGFAENAVELLTPAGTLLRFPYSEIKAVCFVRDFDGGDTWRQHRSFASRPKAPGLWVRLVFLDNDSTEGMLPNNLMLLEPNGFFITPPDPSFQNQRIFVPRVALREVQVVGVIGSRSKLGRAVKTEKAAGQLEMF